MDNLSSHKVTGVRQLIEKAAAEVLDLPPTHPTRTPSKRPWAGEVLRTTKHPDSSGLQKGPQILNRMVTKRAVQELRIIRKRIKK